MGNFLEYFKNNKLVTSIVGISVVGGVGYGAYHKLSQSMTQSQIINDADSTRLRVNQDEEEIDMNRTLYTTVTKTGKMTQIIKGIKVSYVANSQEQCLSPETIMEILKSTIELAGDEYASATRNNRNDRRRARQSKKKNIYLQLITRYNEDCEEILEKAQSQLLLELDIPKDVFEESMLILMDRGFFQQLYMLQASVKQKIKEKIKSTKDINGDLIKKIITYHIQILTNCPEEVKGYITKLQQKPETKDLIPLALNLIIQDLIHEKFGVEEEDQIRCLQKQEIQGDHKINQLLGQIETVMTQFMQSFGLGGMDQLPDSLETFF